MCIFKIIIISLDKIAVSTNPGYFAVISIFTNSYIKSALFGLISVCDRPESHKLKVNKHCFYKKCCNRYVSINEVLLESILLQGMKI